MRSMLLTSVSVIGVLVASAASAQDASKPAAGSDQSTGLAEIVVTAQRTKETLQRAAIPVDVVQGEQLAAAGVTGVGALSQLSPSLTVQPSSTGNLVFVRGVGNFTLVPTSDPAIAFNYDGVYVGRPTSTSTAFFDLDRIEVLKGPQGTLYGRNATGGAINILPTKPRLGETAGYATASYGNYGAFIAEGAVNLPVGDNTALRLSGSTVRHDAYLKDGTSDEKSWALRAQLLSNLTEKLTVRLAADYSDQGGVGVGATYLGRYQYAGPAAGYIFVPSNLPRDEGFYTPAAQAFRKTAVAGPAGRVVNDLAPRPFRDNQFWGVNAEVQYDTDVGTLTLIPAYRHSKLNYLADATGFIARTRETDEQSSLEARFNGKQIGIFGYTIGAFVYDESIDANSGIYVEALASIFRDQLKTKSYAPFVRVTANISDRLRFVVGARYTHDKKTFSELGTSGTIVCQLPTGCPTAPLFPYVDSFTQLTFPFPAASQVPPVAPIGGGAIVARSERSQNNELVNSRTTWRGAVEYDVGPRSLLYASIETGFRSGGFSGAKGFETYNPEYITAYTIGSKNRLLDNRLQLNLEAFQWDYKDQQVNFVGPDATGATANQTRNIGKSQMRGAEVETRFLVASNTLLTADVQYLDAKTKSFVYRTASTPTPPLAGCTIKPATATLADVDCSGMPAFNSPKWTINFAAQQTVPLGATKIVLGADTQYKSEVYWAFQYLSTEVEPGFWRTNAHATYASADDRWSLTAFVQNIENKRTVTFGGITPVLNYLAATTSAPRTYGLRASMKY